jgi:signal transduction histidine kinase
MQPLPDARIKIKFQKDQEPLLRFRVNVILLMGIFLVPLFGVIDYFLYPEHFKRFFLYRGIASGVCLLLFVINRLTDLGSRSLYLGLAAYYGVGLCIIKMIVDVGDASTPYYAGLSLVFIGFGVVLPLSVRRLIPHCIILYLIYFGLTVPAVQTDDLLQFLSRNMFLFSTLVLVMLAAHIDHTLRWREYQLRIELEKTEQELNLYSERLEDMVKEKTDALVQKEQRLRILSSHLLTAQENERRRISLELHDDLGQSLTLLKLQLRGTGKKLRSDQKALKEDLKVTSKSIDKIIEDVRRISRDLTPTIIEHLGFSAAIRSLFLDFARHSDVKVFLELGDVDDLLSLSTQIAVYRIFQEALNNIGKHAEASNISIEVKQIDNIVSFLIQDDGKGFDLQKNLERAVTERSLGLAAMDERAKMLEGQLEVSSQKGKGTKIAFKIPVSIRRQV